MNIDDKRYMKALKKYREIESIADLRKNKLNLPDYYAIPTIMNDMVENGYAETFMDNVKNFLVRCGFTAEEKNGFYIIK